MNLAVIYSPFQISMISERQFAGIKHSIVVVLPVKRYPNSMDSPLDFRTRQMMLNHTFPEITVLPLVDEKYPDIFVKKIEGLVGGIINPLPSTTFFSDDVTIDLYKLHGGKWPVKDYNASLERAIRKTIATNPINSRDFRAGAIYATNRRFPISWMTVDIAITRKFPKLVDCQNFVGGYGTQLLLAQKAGETLWRFPGGFKDRRDKTIEMAVLREAVEEVIGKTDKPASDFFTPPRYLGSRNIDDWRYAGDEDGITTVLYETEFIGNPDLIKASDDIAAVRWENISTITPDIFVPEHIHLWNIFQENHR